MCLGGGGGYRPPEMVKAPPPQPGPESPPDMINNQVVDNANVRDEMEGNRNAMDPTPQPNDKSQSVYRKKSQLKVDAPNTGINL